MKTSELADIALDWSVAKCEGLNVDFDGCVLLDSDYYVPTQDWAQGGPIVEREMIGLWFDQDKQYWIANKQGIPFEQRGPTPLIAAMRCFITSKLGDEVEIPEVLK